MDAEQIRQLEPKLDRFLERFADCFARKDTRAHLGVYVRGQLSNLPEKSVEPIALEAGVAPRTLQEFLSQLKWDEVRLRDRVQQVVLTEHAGAHSIGIFDETSDPKKGDKTPGVQKQWCGRLGKLDNCIVTVHLGYAVDDFHCLLDGALFLPESWAADRDRCREAGIPDTVVYRPKWQIALELYDRASANGLHFDWLTFDEGYGGKPELLRAVTARQQRYVAEVPRSFTGWLKAPRVVTRPYHRGRRGRGRKVPRLASGSRPVRRVDALLKDRVLRDQPWQRWRVKDGDKGPLVWECKHTFLTIKDANGLPGQRLHLVIARNVLDPEEIKFFVSNAPLETGVSTLLRVAFSRWRVERCFQDDKSEIGLDQYEGRRYRGLQRHLVLSAVSYLFLAQVRQEWGEKSGADGVPTAHGHGGVGALLVG
ncbi:MAG TPA: IS701 family transposase [Gemmataceae bacterium]|jgi:SRSO17 transposase|nr:IS701 family transposase [Gemmataceae bacterium]